MAWKKQYQKRWEYDYAEINTSTQMALVESHPRSKNGVSGYIQIFAASKKSKLRQ